jgi:hypothetical protein
MNPRWSATFAVFAILLLLAVSNFVSRPQVRAASVAPVPAFSLHMIERVSYVGSGKYEQTRIDDVYRKSDGSTRSDREILVGARVRDVTIQRPDGTNIRMVPPVGVKKTMKYDQSTLEQKRDYARDPAKRCEHRGYQFAGEEQIQGLRVFKLVNNALNPTSTLWYAPKLGCTLVERLDLFHDSHSLSELKLVSYSAAEPSDELFRADPHLTETDPITLDQAIVRRALSNVTPEILQVEFEKRGRNLKMIQEYYRTHRP